MCVLTSIASDERHRYDGQTDVFLPLMFATLCWHLLMLQMNTEVEDRHSVQAVRMYWLRAVFITNNPDTPGTMATIPTHRGSTGTMASLWPYTFYISKRRGHNAFINSFQPCQATLLHFSFLLRLGIFTSKWLNTKSSPQLTAPRHPAA